jgi:hypothetical protein
MGRDDRGVHRARRWLEAGELVLASASGREPDGRRRRIVLLTERRIVVAWHRGGPAVELGYAATAGRYERDGRLVLVAGGEEHVLREVDAHVARTIVSLITTRRSLAERAPVESHPVLRIVGG